MEETRQQAAALIVWFQSQGLDANDGAAAMHFALGLTIAANSRGDPKKVEEYIAAQKRNLEMFARFIVESRLSWMK
jgi:hypothetical protein